MLDYSTPFGATLPFLVIAMGILAWLLQNYFNKGLNKFDGPLLASLTNWWRLLVVVRRKSHLEYLELHQKFGDVVRLGPNAVSFANPEAVKVIYGLNSKLVKVGSGISPISKAG